jgi:acyl-CoA synthetase (NDP forming)
VIQVDTLDEMFDVAQLLAHQPLPMGPRVAVRGNTDALGLLAADSASAAGLAVEQSVSLGADATADDFERALDDAIDNPRVDSVIAVFIPPLNTTGEQVADVMAAVGEQSDKPVVSTFLASEGVPELLRVVDPAADGSAGRGSVPSYPAPEAAVRALARVVQYSRWVRRPPGAVTVFDDIDPLRARALVGQVLAGEPAGRDLTAAEVTDLLRCYGIDLEPSIPVSTLDEALTAGGELGWDVALKATADHLRQRPDLAHVWRNIDSADDMTAAWRNLTGIIDDLEHAGFVVQRMAPPGIPVAIGSVEDQLFGPIVSFGVAGAPSELLDDVSYRIPPLCGDDAADMVRDVRAAPLLFGYRGSEAIDVPSIERLILRVARLTDDLPEVEALTIGLALASKHGVEVLRATGRVAPSPDARSDWFTRRMAGESSSDDTMFGAAPH